MATLKQSTAYNRTFLMVQTSDHISGLTGATVTVKIGKNGAAGAAAGGAITEIDSTNLPGWYKIALTTTDTNTLGDLTYHCTATSGDPTDFVDQVTANILGDTLPANATQINGVSTSSVTTVNANQGTTQPLNFTGTGASALVKSDMTDIAGAAVSTATAQIGVNLVNVAGSASQGAAGYVGIDWSKINAPTTAQGLSGTTISTAQSIASVSGAVGSVTGAVGSVTGNLGGNVTGSVGSVAGNVGGNVTGSVGSVTAAVTVSGTSPLTEAYPAKNGALTLASALYFIAQFLVEHSTGGTTTWTVKKRDQSTVAKTFTLDSATAPTSITEAT
jgi:hypothetical protein